MTAAHQQRDDSAKMNALFQQACFHFNCEERTLGRFDLNAAKRDPQRTKKRQRLAKIVDRYHEVMSGPNPPQTKQQAVEAIAPLVTLILSIFFRQFAIQVIEWLWDQLEQQDAATGNR